MGLPNNLGKLSNMITSTGSLVGVGTTTPKALFEVGGTAGTNIAINSEIAPVISNNAYYAGGGWKYRYSSFGTYLNLSSDGSINFATAPSGSADAAISWTERLKITNTGNVGIGTSSPALNLHIFTSGTSFTSSTITYSSATSRGILLDNSAGTSQSGNGIWFANSGLYSAIASTRVNTGNWGTDLRFYTHPDETTNQFDVTERMRITSGGYLKASPNGTYLGASSAFHEIRQTTASDSLIIFNHSGTSPIGTETSFSGADPNNTTNYVYGAYTTSPSFVWIYRIWSNGTVSGRSDARWKKNIETTRDGYLEDLAKLRVVKYNWYNHEENAPKELGLIAQEVEEVFPNLIQYDKVTTKKQIEQEDGTFIEQEVEDGESRSVKVSVLPYMLLKALQEANTKIEELSAKVTALENKA